MTAVPDPFAGRQARLLRVLRAATVFAAVTVSYLGMLSILAWKSHLRRVPL